MGPPNGLTFSREPRESSFGTWISYARGSAAATWCYASSSRERPSFDNLTVAFLGVALVVLQIVVLSKTSFNFRPRAPLQ